MLSSICRLTVRDGTMGKCCSRTLKGGRWLPGHLHNSESNVSCTLIANHKPGDHRIEDLQVVRACAGVKTLTVRETKPLKLCACCT